MWKNVLQRCHMSAPRRPFPTHGEGQTSCMMVVRAYPERIWRSHHHAPADSSAPHRGAGPVGWCIMLGYGDIAMGSCWVPANTVALSALSATHRSAHASLDDAVAY